MQIPISSLGGLGFGAPAPGARAAPVGRAPTISRRAALNALGDVPRADAVALAARLAATERALAAANEKVARLTATLASLSRRAGAPVAPPRGGASSSGPRAAAQAAAPAPATVPAREAVVDVSAQSVDGYEAPSPEDRAWFGEHLSGSEPADFSGDLGDLDADLGLEGD